MRADPWERMYGYWAAAMASSNRALQKRTEFIQGSGWSTLHVDEVIARRRYWCGSALPADSAEAGDQSASPRRRWFDNIVVGHLVYWFVVIPIAVVVIQHFIVVLVAVIGGLLVAACFKAFGRSTQACRAMNAETCPKCDYALHSLGVWAPSSAGEEIFIGPELCPECGYALPLVPPPTRL